MSNKQIIKWSLINSIGVLLYVSGIAWIMQNGEKIFGKMNHVRGAVAFLLLFVFSALVTGLLTLGRPAFLFLDGLKKEAVKMLIYTTGWMFAITVLALGMNFLLK
jgi:hypothetical protein